MQSKPSPSSSAASESAHAKCIALLDACLELKTGELAFEYAYCCYRVGGEARLEEALEVASLKMQSNDNNNYFWRNLYAQILFKMDRHLESLVVYARLLKDTDETDYYHDELHANAAATLALALIQNGRRPSDDIISAATAANVGDTYEYVFNRACILLSEGRLTEAEQELIKAQSEL